MNSFFKNNNDGSMYEILKECAANKELIKKYYDNEYSLADITGDIIVVKIYDNKGDLYVYILDAVSGLNDIINKYGYTKEGYYNDRKIKSLIIKGVRIENQEDINYFMKAVNEVKYEYNDTDIENAIINYEDSGSEAIGNVRLSSKMIKRLDEIGQLQTEQEGE
jgi:hypothetical protein